MRGIVAATLAFILAPQAGAMDSAPPSSASAAEPLRTVEQIQVTGNTRIGTAELLRVAGVRIGDTLSGGAIEAAMARIAAAYRARGNELALKADIAPLEGAHARLTFIIVELEPAARRGALPRSGARSGGVPPPPPPEERR